MRRIEDFKTETAVTIVAWLDEFGAETTDEDMIEDYLVETETGERCLMAAEIFDAMSDAGFVEEAKLN